MGELKKRILVAIVAVPTVLGMLTNYTACCCLLLVAVLLCYREFRTMAMILMRFTTGKEEKDYILQLQSHPATFLAHIVMPLYCIIGISQALHDVSWDLVVGLQLEATAIMALRIYQYKQQRDRLVPATTPDKPGPKKPEEEYYMLPKYRILSFQAICYDYSFMLFVCLSLSSGLHILHLKNRGKVLIMWVGLTWQTDQGGFVFGKLFGQRKLADFISTNKTVEGALGGYLLSLFTILVLNLLLPDVLTPPMTFLQSVVAGLAFSTTAVVGDLGISFLKRAAHMKDASDLLPGHGGLMDRIDSLCLGCPVAYILVKAFGIP